MASSSSSSSAPKQVTPPENIVPQSLQFDDQEGLGCLSDIDIECPSAASQLKGGRLEALARRFTTVCEKVHAQARGLTKLPAPRLLAVDSSALPRNQRHSRRLAYLVETFGLEPLVDQLSSEAAGLAEDDDEENSPYCAVYAVAVGVFVVAALLYFWPSLDLHHRLCGGLLAACSLFLVMNSEVVVTTARMAYQVLFLRDTNGRFGLDLDRQASKLRRLYKAKRGLSEVEARYGGNIELAVRECERLQHASRSDLAGCTKHLCQLYCLKEPDEIIANDQELEECLQLMSAVFGSSVKDYAAREHRLREGLCGKAVLRRDGGIKRRIFEEVLEYTLVEPDVQKIPRRIRRMLDSQSQAAPQTPPFRRVREH